MGPRFRHYGTKVPTLWDQGSDTIGAKVPTLWDQRTFWHYGARFDTMGPSFGQFGTKVRTLKVLHYGTRFQSHFLLLFYFFVLLIILRVKVPTLWVWKARVKTLWPMRFRHSQVKILTLWREGSDTLGFIKPRFS